MGLLISDQTFDKFFEADYQAKQEAQLPQRDSASATHIFLGSLDTDHALN